MLLQLLALAWLLGSVLAALGGHWVIAGLFGVLLGIWGSRSQNWSLRMIFTVFLAAVSLGGALSYLHRRPEALQSDVSRFVDSGPIRVRGVVEGDRDERERTLVLRVRATRVEDASGWHDATGLVLARLPLSDAYVDGDMLELRGRLISPPNRPGFDYRAYLARQGIYAESDYPATRLLARNSAPGLQHEIFRLRSHLDGVIRSALPEPEASLAAGMALGTRRIIDPSLSADFASTDAAMIAIATGYNVTVAGLLLLSGLAWLIGRRQAALAAIIAMVAYAVFLGPYPSVLRAAAMGTIVMAAIVVGRPHAAIRALLIASAVMVALDPSAMESISFPLTLAATAGVVWLAPPLARVLRESQRLRAGRGDRLPLFEGITDNVAMTLAAVVPALPILLVVSHRVSLASLPVNLVLFPLVPALTALSLGTALAGAVWHPLALLFAPADYALLWFMIAVVRFCARLPAAEINLDWFGPWAAIALYATAGSLAWLARFSDRLPSAVLRVGGATRDAFEAIRLRLVMATREPRSTRTARVALPARLGLVAAGCAGVVFAVLVVSHLASGGSDVLRVTYLDVGPGSAILVESASQRMLVDAGPGGDATVRALDRVLPPWQRSVNVVVLTDPAVDHAGGLTATLSRYHVGAVIDAGASTSADAGAAPALDDWQAAPLPSQAMKIPRAPTSYFQLGAWQISVREPPSAAGGTLNASERQRRAHLPATVIAESGARRIVLAGDPTAAIAADVRTIDRTNASMPPSPPRVAVLEASQGNAASPAPDREASGFASTLVYRTTENGDVTVEISSFDLHVRVARGPALGLMSGR